MLRLLGFRFETGLLTSAVQDVDPRLLETHLLQSLWYLHGQPPLWNALIGASFKVSHWPQLWHVVYVGLGLAEILMLFALQRDLGLPKRASAVLALLFSLSPEVLLYENFFFYDYPTLVAVTAGALAAGRFTARPSLGRGLAFFGVCGYLTLTRTLFELPWLVAVIVVTLVACRRQRRLVLASCAIPLALLVGVYAKNWFMFGVPSTTSWTGMGLARVAVEALPLSERRQLVAEGKLHAVSLVTPLAPLRFYEAVGVKLDPPTGIPLLDETEGPSATRNLENRTYIRISREYWSDDLWIIFHRTTAYLAAVGRGYADFFASPTNAWQGGGNDGHIRSYDHWFTRIVYGRLGPGKVGFFLVAAYILALAAGIVECVRRLRPGADPMTVTIAFATLTLLYVGTIGNFAEVGENFRFRLVVDPLVLAICAVVVQRAGRRWLSRSVSRARPPR